MNLQEVRRTATHFFKQLTHLTQIENLPSSPAPFSPLGRRGVRDIAGFFLSPSPSLGEGLGVRVLKPSAYHE
jgi:hypothetical protein